MITMNISPLQDSGARRDFPSGAVRDAVKGMGKGRCDLMPLDIICQFVGPEPDKILLLIEDFQRSGDTEFLKEAITLLIDDCFGDTYDALLELAVHFEDGANKYADRNWEKGMPVHCFIDSAVRHYIKWLRGDEDEKHERACFWNLVCAWWTMENHPDQNDLPIKKQETCWQNIKVRCDNLFKGCHNCKYENLSDDCDPCTDCEDNEYWEAPNEGKECDTCRWEKLAPTELPCDTCSDDSSEWESNKGCFNCEWAKYSPIEGAPCRDCCGDDEWIPCRVCRGNDEWTGEK